MPEIESDPTPLSRIELLRLAQSLGVSDADVMTRAELRAAIEQAKAPAPAPIEHPTTWVSVARRLLARVIERGLNLPDAAALVRGDAKLTTPPKAPPPVATVTLARIYAAQGHVDRAIVTLDEVLESDPDHELARDLRAQLELRRQESLARDADSLPSVRPEEELTPIMPEVVLRDAAERGASASAEPATVEPAPSTDPAPTSEAPGELVAPAFAVAERAEASASLAQESQEAQAIVETVKHDSETPPAPSVLSVAELETEAPAGPAPVEPPAVFVEPSPPSEPEPTFHASAANGVENGLGYASPSLAIDPSASSSARSSDPDLALPPATPVATEVLPRVPGLVLIEAERRQYLYWELGSSSAAPCWLHVVSHTPAVDGHTERRERRFPVQQRFGALRIEGVPSDAVVRAKLSQDPDGRPVAVAGAVRSHDDAIEIQFCPHPRAPLEAIARRAEPVLARATPVYLDC